MRRAKIAMRSSETHQPQFTTTALRRCGFDTVEWCCSRGGGRTAWVEGEPRHVSGSLSVHRVRTHH